MSAIVLKLEQLAELWEQNRAAGTVPVKEFAIGGRQFTFNSRPAIMGVVNLSPDSWYRESVCLTAEAALRRGRGFDRARCGRRGCRRGIHPGPCRAPG